LLFRAAQEALRNAAKHSGASAIDVRVAAEHGHAVLAVCDDGRGFDPALLDERAADGHLGLRLVRDLVDDAGGELTVRTAHGQGTQVRVDVPLA
jgi:signal transduction histidine kinase